MPMRADDDDAAITRRSMTRAGVRGIDSPHWQISTVEARLVGSDLPAGKASDAILQGLAAQGLVADASSGGPPLSMCSASFAQACAMSRRATLRAESVTVCAISAQ
jgi:hypothetical protein